MSFCYTIMHYWIFIYFTALPKSTVFIKHIWAIIHLGCEIPLENISEVPSGYLVVYMYDRRSILVWI